MSNSKISLILLVLAITIGFVLGVVWAVKDYSCEVYEDNTTVCILDRSGD